MPRNEANSGPSDRDRVEHMLVAGRAAVRFCAGRKRGDLESDDMLRRALVNTVQEIGEAAARTTDVGRVRVNRLPWGQIVAMRHVLVHVYWGVDNDQLWNTATIDIPAMIEILVPALAQWPAE